MAVQAQDCKYVQVIPPTAITDNGAHAEVEIDTLGYHYAEIIFFLGATDIGITELTVAETDTTGSGEADVTEFVVGTALDMDGVASALPSATDDGQVTVFQIDLRKRKRFLSLVAVHGNGSVGGFAAAVCRLSRGDVAEITSTAIATGGVLRA